MTTSSKPLLIGLLGGIGSGKSEVSRLLTEAGARVINGDEIGHRALREPAIRAAVVAAWGKELLGEDGEIIRRKLGSIVFADATQLRRLEALVHPWIRETIVREIQRAREVPGISLIVLDAAILLEAGWDAGIDSFLFVDTPREMCLKRVAQTRGWTEKEVELRERAQMPLDEKACKAAFRIANHGTKEELRAQVETLLRQWGLRM